MNFSATVDIFYVNIGLLNRMMQSKTQRLEENPRSPILLEGDRKATRREELT